MTSSSKTSAPSKVERSEAPETVGTSCRSSRAISAAQAARLEEVLHQVLARRADVREHRDRAGELVEAREIEGDAGPARHGDQVDDRVGRAAEREHDGDRVLEVLRRERRGTGSETMRRPAATAIRGWSECAAGIEAAPGMRHAQAPRPPTSSSTPFPSSCSGPGEEAIACSTSSQSACVMFPARSSAQYFHTSEPEPRVSPRQLRPQHRPARDEDEREASRTRRP